MKEKLLTCLVCLFGSLGFMSAQEISSSDTIQNPIEQTVSPTDSISSRPLSKKELRRQKVAKRNFHYNILGGPSYTPDFGVLIGGTALMTFRMDPGYNHAALCHPGFHGFHVYRRIEHHGKTPAVFQE